MYKKKIVVDRAVKLDKDKVYNFVSTHNYIYESAAIATTIDRNCYFDRMKEFDKKCSLPEVYQPQENNLSPSRKGYWFLVLSSLWFSCFTVVSHILLCLTLYL